MERQHLEDLANKDKLMSTQINEAVVHLLFCIVLTNYHVSQNSLQSL